MLGLVVVVESVAVRVVVVVGQAVLLETEKLGELVFCGKEGVGNVTQTIYPEYPFPCSRLPEDRFLLLLLNKEPKKELRRCGSLSLVLPFWTPFCCT